MKKIPLFFLSLIGAAPAGFLTYLLCMYLIDQPAGANSTVMIFAILTVLCTAPLTLLPVLILVLYYSNYDPPKIPKASKKDPEDDEKDAADDADAVEEDADADDGASKKGKGKKGKKDEDEEVEEEIFDDTDEMMIAEDEEDRK